MNKIIKYLTQDTYSIIEIWIVMLAVYHDSILLTVSFVLIYLLRIYLQNKNYRKHINIYGDKE